MSTLYDQYKTTLQKHADIEHSIAILQWDKEVNAPTKGSDMRARQLATLSGMAHELMTDNAFGDLLQQLDEKSDQLAFAQAKNIKGSLKEYQREKKYSTDFVMRRSRVVSNTYDAWLKAREANDYKLYKEALKQMVELKIEETEVLGYDGHPYNALIEEFEPGAKVADIDKLFTDVRQRLVAFAAQLKEATQVDNAFLKRHFPKSKQWDFGIHLLKNMGYDFEAGRQDISAHPFTTSFGSRDVRVTTRIDEQDFGNMTWSCIHEGGHALYEQGLPATEYGLPSGKYISLGIHESQSRLWENNVGRSLPYWRAHYKDLQKVFPESLGDISINDFYKGINRVEPSLIRTEADEIHYHLHVLIRYEIEKAMLEGKAPLDSLDEYWNAKYKEYLGVDVPDDRRGILQDIHWAHGSIGYFPTYSLGSFYAAQFFQQAKKDIPSLLTHIEAGNNAPLLEWLGEKVFQHGRNYSAQELCERITGEALNFDYFMDYIEEKYRNIYEL
ncbi:MAG: carboxypeptidase M32 [Bacteroidota bacterium]